MILISKPAAVHAADGVRVPQAAGLRRAKHLHSTGPLLLALWQQGGALAIVRRLALGACVLICSCCEQWTWHPPHVTLCKLSTAGIFMLVSVVPFVDFRVECGVTRNKASPRQRHTRHSLIRTLPRAGFFLMVIGQAMAKKTMFALLPPFYRSAAFC